MGGSKEWRFEEGEVEKERVQLSKLHETLCCYKLERFFHL